MSAQDGVNIKLNENDRTDNSRIILNRSNQGTDLSVKKLLEKENIEVNALKKSSSKKPHEAGKMAYAETEDPPCNCAHPTLVGSDGLS